MNPSKQIAPAPSILRQLTELEHLDTPYTHKILETGSEKVFDDLAQLSAFVCDAPMALISLIDGEHQWFKTTVGLDAKQISRKHAFCQYAMQARDVYEIPDAAADSRFADNPLVVGDPHIRFYAGAPLLTPEGQCLGILCAFDVVPRQLSPRQREALRMLARQVMAHLDLRRIRIQLEDERQKLDGVLRMANQTSDIVLASNQNEIFVKQEQRLVRVATVDLQYVEALGDYVNMYTTRERLTVYGTMKDLETKLPGNCFARVHRKYIVRLDRILSIEADVAMLDGSSPTNPNRPPVRVPIGSSYKAGLLGRLNVV